eukprot:CAMPEP_0170608626 /NCGR_PEP_ID=MMETSP0224-20130122/21687_1 /TAXON_ID=285029 /ORGANISM="Togula jolla, Strain CCCM 725" /LENGTH=122 /DNA_ID=CAMNT_0010933869 /DNA_START=898 /DNA_END=1266 /DNA_ORIENTATION=-
MTSWPRPEGARGRGAIPWPHWRRAVDRRWPVSRWPIMRRASAGVRAVRLIDRNYSPWGSRLPSTSGTSYKSLPIWVDLSHRLMVCPLLRSHKQLPSDGEEVLSEPCVHLRCAEGPELLSMAI